MENAAKALAIAAAVIFTLLVISLLVILYNQLSSYYSEKNKMTEIEQLQAFNARFANYHDKEIRGNELVSIMNNIVDYNNLQSDMLGYKPVVIEIDLLDDEYKEEFKYNKESGGSTLITGKKIHNSNGTNDYQIAQIAGTSARLSKDLGITDVKLQRLSAQIANIVDENEQSSNEYKEEYRIYRAQVLTRIFGEKIDVDDPRIPAIESAT